MRGKHDFFVLARLSALGLLSQAIDHLLQPDNIFIGQASHIKCIHHFLRWNWELHTIVPYRDGKSLFFSKRFHMTNFGDWKHGVYDPIYDDFQHRKDTKLETETTKTLESLRRRNKVSERNEVFESFRFNDVLKSPLGIIFRDTFSEYINIPCFSCRKATGKTKNHTYPLSNLMSRFLSKDGHLVGFHSGTEKEVVVANDQPWAFPKGTFKKQGEKEYINFLWFLFAL